MAPLNDEANHALCLRLTSNMIDLLPNNEELCLIDAD